MKLTHKDAAEIVKEAFRRVFGRLPTRAERQLLQAVAWLETGYGQHWDNRGAGSNNWGAIQATKIWTGKTFAYVDTRPNDDGTSTPYDQLFRAYDSAADGAADLAKVVFTGGRNPPLGMRDKVSHVYGARGLLVLEPAKRGDAEGFSSGLYDTVYYQGFGRTREERIKHHLLAVNNACNKMALEIKEPLPNGEDPVRPIPVYRRGDWGPDIEIIQRLIDVKDDGRFGPGTEAALKVWQKKNNLKPDGIWGPVCFAVAIDELNSEEVDELRSAA